MKIAFGQFIVDDDGILINDNYRISADRLWETREFKKIELWDWLIHLTEKTWVTSENVGDLNTAFLFAQDYFKDSKPTHAGEGSTFQTLYVQKQMIENDEERERQRNDKLNGRPFDLNDFLIDATDDIQYKDVNLL